MALIALLALVRSIRRRSRETRETPELWECRNYRSLSCRGPMASGWVMLGPWGDLGGPGEGPPGAFGTIASAQSNTLGLAVRPAGDQAWRCPGCQLLLEDDSQCVGPRP